MHSDNVIEFDSRHSLVAHVFAHLSQSATFLLNRRAFQRTTVQTRIHTKKKAGCQISHTLRKTPPTSQGSKGATVEGENATDTSCRLRHSLRFVIRSRLRLRLYSLETAVPLMIKLMISVPQACESRMMIIIARVLVDVLSSFRPPHFVVVAVVDTPHNCRRVVVRRARMFGGCGGCRRTCA